MELLTFVTAGSVDDGKSTLIGRLLYETGCVTDDQVEAVARSSSRMGLTDTNLALFTDGLRAEREQGITIDLAYRYFATARRKFIIADAPGHVQYTRNMVCGASVADLALLLVDARAGLTEQTRRHAFILSLLGVPHWLVAVNKMDLVDYTQGAFERIRDEFSEFVGRLRVRDLTFIPVSALAGDNIVIPSKQMSWHSGGTVLNHLENVHIRSDRNLIDARFPVQYVLRPRSDQFHDYRGYAGQLASGTLHAGEEVMVLPSGMQTRIESISLGGEGIPEASASMSIALTLADDVDVSRGDLICRPANQPSVVQDIDAMVCWMDGSAEAGTRLLIKHTTKTVRAVVRDIAYRIDVNTRHRTPTESLSANDIARVRLRAAQPIMCDDFERNKTTGSFIAVDPASGRTVAAGMINRGAR
jgi:sulfate adenylyltransferase large subunit